MNVTRFARRRGFTLVELLVVCAIVAVLLSMVLFALRGAAEQARVDRTRAQINKINDLLMTRWEGYRQRPLPIRIPANTDPRQAAMLRLQATWCLMRFEIPERKTDLTGDVPGFLQTYGMRTPSLLTAYRRKITALTGGTVADGFNGWTAENQQAECLWLVLSTIRDGDTTGLDFFSANEIRDTDGDNVPEIVDGWGTPIRFLRWAPGIISNMQSGNPADQPDPFDPLKVVNQLNPSAVTPQGFALFPIIFSAGPDGKFDMFLDRETPDEVNYSLPAMAPPPPNFPYQDFGGKRLGEPFDIDGNGYFDHQDNITNHLQVVR